MRTGKVVPQGSINFPGFVRVHSFTATGGETETIKTGLDGDTAGEYIIWVSHKANDWLSIQLNGDNGSNYGYETLENYSGAVAASGGALSRWRISYATGSNTGSGFVTLRTPSGMVKTIESQMTNYSTGTTVVFMTRTCGVWNNTANVTQIRAYLEAGTFTAGDKVIIFKRSSNT